MSASPLRRSAALVVAFASALVLGATTPTAAATPGTASTAAHGAKAQLHRESGNGCGWADFSYTYAPDGDGYYTITVDGRFGWVSDWPECGRWGRPYAPVLQWKGVSEFTGGFEWSRLRAAEAPDQQDLYVNLSGYKDVRFRVCNLNTNTGYMGTCGSS
jgi:hypothetical protein